jgi:hypothetical protein
MAEGVDWRDLCRQIYREITLPCDCTRINDLVVYRKRYPYEPVEEYGRKKMRDLGYVQALALSRRKQRIQEGLSVPPAEQLRFRSESKRKMKKSRFDGKMKKVRLARKQTSWMARKHEPQRRREWVNTDWRRRAEQETTDRIQGWRMADRDQLARVDKLRKEEKKREKRKEEERIEREQNERIEREQNESIVREQNETIVREQNERIEREQNERIEREQNERIEREQNERIMREQNEEAVQKEKEDEMGEEDGVQREDECTEDGDGVQRGKDEWRAGEGCEGGRTSRGERGVDDDDTLSILGNVSFQGSSVEHSYGCENRLGQMSYQEDRNRGRKRAMEETDGSEGFATRQSKSKMRMSR